MIDQMASRVKKRGEGFGLQMKELAKDTDFASTLISQIESGKAFSSILTHKKRQMIYTPQ